MPIFKIENSKVNQIKKVNFTKEKNLQEFCEENLTEIFDVKFIKSEHVTGEKHGGRIDTLGIDADGNPVIIEYKKQEDENIISQGLFYCDWLVDHHGDFKDLVQEKLGNKIEISWNQPRIILVAQSFSKYDKHAINRMADNIELWIYNLYENGIFSIERIGEIETEKQRKEQKIFKKEIDQEKYNYDYHVGTSIPKLQNIFTKLRGRILELPGVEERSEQRTGISYRTTISFVRFEFGKNQIRMLVRSPKYNDPQKLVQDITNFKWGYRGLVKIREGINLEDTFAILKQSYEETL